MKYLLQKTLHKTLSTVSKKHKIAIQSGRCGFFGDLFMTLNGISFCESISVFGYPFWGEQSLYYDSKSGGNAWEYFFEPITNSYKQNAYYLPTIPYWPTAASPRVLPGETARSSVFNLLSKYVVIKSPIQKEVDSFLRCYFTNNRIIGVHVRKTDTAKGIEDRATTNLQFYLDEINEQMVIYPRSSIYLATDDKNTLNLFQHIYKDRLIFQNCMRSSDGNSIHGHYDEGVKGNAYQKGVEVLIDALLLANCDFLIRGHSRVTCFSLCSNPALQFVDVEKKYLGIDRTPWLHS